MYVTHTGIIYTPTVERALVILSRCSANVPDQYRAKVKDLCDKMESKLRVYMQNPAAQNPQFGRILKV